jgi:hypothetical protein
MTFLSPLFSLLVLLSWDLILSPYREGGCGWYSLSSPLLLPTGEHRLGSGDNNLPSCSMRGTPSGLPPFSYYFIRLPSFAPACWFQQQQEFFGAYSLDDLVCLLCFLLLSLLLELCRLILVGATNPFLSHGAVMTPMIGWSPLNYVLFLCQSSGFFWFLMVMV